MILAPMASNDFKGSRDTENTEKGIIPCFPCLPWLLLTPEYLDYRFRADAGRRAGEIFNGLHAQAVYGIYLSLRWRD